MLEKDPKIIITGEKLVRRVFEGGNQALPVLDSALHNNGFNNVVQFDMEDPRNTFERLLHEAESANLIMFSGTFSVQLDQVDRHVSVLRRHLQNIRRGDVPIIVGGYGAAGVERYARYAPFIDAFSYGPGIEQVPQIARSVQEGRFWQDLRSSRIPGLSYYDTDTERFVKGKDIPMPSAEGLGTIDQLYRRNYLPIVHDMDIFQDENGNTLPTFQLVTELGCPFDCAFCSESGGEDQMMFFSEVLRRGVIERTKKGTEVPLETIEKTFRKARELGYRGVYFDIETAFRDWKRMESILEMAHSYGFVSGLNTRIDTARQDRIERAAQLGVVYAFFGVEHMNPQVLLAVDKFMHPDLRMRARVAQQYFDRVRDIFRWMRNSGSLFLIMGLPKVDNESWEKVLNGEITKTHEMVYESTSFEDDVLAIKKSIAECRPRYFNANVLRFNPDTSMAWQRRFACVRPSGEAKLDAVYNVPRVARLLGIPLQEFHPIYRFFEGVEDNQPYTTAMNPQRAYDTAAVILAEASKYGTEVYFDYALAENGLVTRDSSGHYKISSLKDFEGLK